MNPGLSGLPTLFITALLVLLLMQPPSSVRADPDDTFPGYYGMGPGMMGGYGYGPGMMGGYGYGPGMMGPGMMGGYGPLAALDLTQEQRDKIRDIQNELRKNHWAATEKMLDAQAQLDELYTAETPDAKKIGAAYGRLAKLQQEQIEANVNASNRIQGMLTKEQKEQLRQWRRGSAGPGGGGYGRDGYGPGNPPPGMGPGMMRR